MKKTILISKPILSLIVFIWFLLCLVVICDSLFPKILGIPRHIGFALGCTLLASGVFLSFFKFKDKSDRNNQDEIPNWDATNFMIRSEISVVAGSPFSGTRRISGLYSWWIFYRLRSLDLPAVGKCRRVSCRKSRKTRRGQNFVSLAIIAWILSTGC